MELGAGLPWALVVGLMGYSGWLHRHLSDLREAHASLRPRVEALEKSGTNGTVTAAITALSEELRAMNDKLESDFQMVTLCLIQLSNGNKITPADLKRKH
jgi:hypothetical protein